MQDTEKVIAIYTYFGRIFIKDKKMDGEILRLSKVDRKVMGRARAGCEK